jgi:glucokinase
VGVDLGGTKVAAALVSADGRTTHRVVRPTVTDSSDTLVAQVADVVHAVLAEAGPDERVDAVGIGAAGLVDRDRTTVRFAPNLPLADIPLGDLVARETGLPVKVENDANAAAWAEYRFGAGKRLASVAVVTVGTGIGAGIVLDGRLYRGRHGLAAEVGHLVLDPQGPPCPCGGRGCLEAFASGPALLALATRLATERPGRLSVLAGRSAAIRGTDVMYAALDGDPAAVAAFEHIGTRLGTGLAGLAAVLDLDAFILGGGVADGGDLLRLPTESALAAHLVGGAHRPPPQVRLARLGGEGGIIGAADLARRALAEPSVSPALDAR